MQLQEEKEKQFYENRSGFNEMVRAKDHEIQTLQSSLRQAQRDLDARNEVGGVWCVRGGEECDRGEGRGEEYGRGGVWLGGGERYGV